MLKRNFLAMPLEDVVRAGEGGGVLRHACVFKNDDFKTQIRFLNYTILPPGTFIGLHPHRDDEELYIILDGSGEMEADGAREPVGPGDIVVNRPFGTHGLYNTSDRDLSILVMEVGGAEA